VIFIDDYYSVCKSIGIYRWNYRRHIQKNYKKKRRFADVEVFVDNLPTESPRDSNQDLHAVMWPIHHRNCRRNHRHKKSVGDSISKSEYITTLPTLSSPISTSFFLSQLSPPKLQTTTPPKKKTLFLTQVIFLYVLWSQHPCSDLLWILSFFISKSIFFNFNIYMIILNVNFIVFLVYVFC
jgi:hypothetical protein